MPGPEGGAVVGTLEELHAKPLAWWAFGNLIKQLHVRKHALTQREERSAMGTPWCS